MWWYFWWILRVAQGEMGGIKVNYVQRSHEFDRFLNIMIHSQIVGVAYLLCILLLSTTRQLMGLVGANFTDASAEEIVIRNGCGSFGGKTFYEISC